MFAKKIHTKMLSCNNTTTRGPNPHEEVSKSRSNIKSNKGCKFRASLSLNSLNCPPGNGSHLYSHICQPICSWNLVLVLVIFILLQLVTICPSLSIGRDKLEPAIVKTLNVDYYEPVFYNPEEFLEQHLRKKREIGSNKEALRVDIFSKSRNFRLNLNEDKSVFHPDVEIENSDGRIDYDTSRVLVGRLEDEPGSFVEGLVASDGHFDGVISTESGQEFHLEPSHRYALDRNKSPGIIYEKDAVQWPKQPPKCASHELYLKTLRDSANISIPEDNDSISEAFPAPNYISQEPSNISSTHKPFNQAKLRSKRYAIDPRKRTCMLYLQADHLFYSHFGTEEATINMMARHIQRVNEIYRSTDFDGDGTPDAISFMIKRIKVHTANDTLKPGYKYTGDFQVIQFLERFSEGDYESFCLAYMFTFRDFEGGTLGLAWTGDLKNAGGVCERKGHFRGGLKSLNTGIVTLLNYGKIVLPAVSYVTLAHEIGHNFGSPHDPESDKECVPGGRDGNYIMFARATAGDQRNNQKFSPCSLRNIMPVLNSKARNVHGCFSEPQQGICGNREVEQGEECDCGWEEDCKEPCCWPMRVKYEPSQVPCTLRPKVECSPSQGVCCTGNCTLRIGDKCRDDNGCRNKAYCDGYMAQCPPSVHKPNKTVCHEEQNVCFMGECTGSICLAYGLESCQCSPQTWDSASKVCELCCKRPGEGQPCMSSFEWNEAPYDVPDLFAKPGSPCKNYTGYCDNYHMCREVDPSGPLATLRNLLLADEGLSAIADWIDTHWYAVISIIVLLLVMMILTAKMCGKQAKKKLRKITVMHSNLEAIQVERSYWDEGGEHVVHPEAIRKKIPLRKKIREKKSKGKNGRTKSGKSRPTTGGHPAGSSENKAPRYGTLWRKRRSAERARLAAATAPPLKTDSAALNHDLKGPTTPTSPSQNSQAIDLIQLKTPSTSQSQNKPEFPKPEAGPSDAGRSGARSGPSPSSSEGLRGVGNRTPQTSSSANNAHSSGSPRSPQGIYPSIDPLTAAMVNHHEPKTAILPSRAGPTGGGRRKKRSSSKRHSSGREVHRSKSRTTLASPNAPEAAAASSSRKKVPKEGDKPPKKSIQIVYTPPFSVQVVKTSKSAATTPTPNTPVTTPTTVTVPRPAAALPRPAAALPRPAAAVPHDSSSTSIENKHQSRPSTEIPSANKTKPSKKPATPPIIPESPKGSPSPVPASEPPPPYSKTNPEDANLTGSGATVATVPANPKMPRSHSGQVVQGVKSKVKSSGSFLQRKKQKANKSEELKVLIPPPNLDDDDVTSPVTPGS